MYINVFDMYRCTDFNGNDMLIADILVEMFDSITVLSIKVFNLNR